MTDTEFPIIVSPKAIERLKRLVAKDGREGVFLRLGVKGGGCSGLEYVIKLDTKPTKIDLTAEFEGIKVACDSKSAEYLRGAVLEFTDNLIGGGFKFENPNAARSCGCGTSFTPKTVTSKQ